MDSADSKLGSLIIQLHNRTNEVKEAFDEALVELERQKVTNEKQYKARLEALDEERRIWTEEKATVEKLVASATPIITLNVGGETMSTSRATLTIIKSSALAMMFSGKWEDKLIKDTHGNIFLDYDPVLFKFLLNQLRLWSDPSVKRVFRLPVGSEQSFLEFVRILNFNEEFIDSERSTITTAAKIGQSEQRQERFGAVSSASVQLTNDGLRCENTASNVWQYVLGTLTYSTGMHRIRLKLENGTVNIMMGICSQSKQPTGPSFYDQPTAHGWFTHGYVVINGKGSHPGWPQVAVNDIVEITINCEKQALGILNERSRAQHTIEVNIAEAPFPWCLFLVFYQINSKVSLS